MPKADECPAEADFYRWLVRNWGKATAMVTPSILAAVSKPLIDVAPSVFSGLVPYREGLPYLLNVLAIAILLYFLMDEPKVQEGKYAAPTRGVQEFARWWHGMWFAWFVLYLLMTAVYWTWSGPGTELMKDFRGSGELPKPLWFVVDAAMTAVSLTVCACLVMCYLVLARGRAAGAQLGGRVAMIYVVLLLVVAAVPTASLLGKMNKPLFEMHLLFLNTSYATLFCVSLCILVGRLESRVIAPPVLVIVFLYAYGALFLGLNVIDSAGELPGTSSEVSNFARGTLRTFLVVTAFLKALLFLFVYWLLRSGVLLFYMQWMAQAREGKDSIDARRCRFVEEMARPHIGEPGDELGLEDPVRPGA